MAQPAEKMVRPRRRAECESGPRPCPWSDCRHHLDGRRGESCALDVASWGGASLKEIAELLGVSKQRAHQICVVALVRLRARLPFEGAR